jgi:hypothetical protein
MVDIRGVFVYWYRPFYFGSDRSAVNKQFELFQLSLWTYYWISSTMSHIKNGPVPSKRLRPDYDFVPVRRSVPINEHSIGCVRLLDWYWNGTK